MEVYCFNTAVKFLKYERLAADIHGMTYAGVFIGCFSPIEISPLEFFCNWLQTADAELLKRVNLNRAEYWALYETQTYRSFPNE